MVEAVFFYLFAITMLAAAVAVVRTRHPIYSVLSLLVVLFCLAALFVMQGAYFLAALQVLLYAGAVLVLFLFVIMLLNLSPEALAHGRIFTLRAAGVIAASWLLLLLSWLFTAPPLRPPRPTGSLSGDVESIGRLLFTKYLLPFELTSFLILAAIIGAVTLAKRTPSR